MSDRTSFGGGSASPLITLSGATRLFEMGGRSVGALNEIDLTLDGGEFVAVMGPSGSGKTTLLNIVGCLDRPTGGVYLLDGKDIGAASARARARLRNRRFGFIFQEFHLLSRLTAAENVELPLLYRGFGRAERKRRVEAALDAVGLAGRAKHTPKQMSGGEQQRTAIARALVGHPDIILADEPTGALDSVTGARVVEALQELNNQGLTILVVTHDESVASHADRLVRLRDGQILSDSKELVSAFDFVDYGMLEGELA